MLGMHGHCSATDLHCALFVPHTEAVDAKVFHTESRASRGKGIL